MTPADAFEAVQHYGSIRAAARALGVPYATMHKRYARADRQPMWRKGEVPASDISVDEIIGEKVRHFERKMAARKAATWLPVDVPEALPFGLACFGDTHVDGTCDWPLLMRDAKIATQPGVYGVFVGDVENAWPGRLGRLYGQQNTGRERARKLVKWFYRDAGIRWLCIVLGNHDRFGESQQAFLEMLADSRAHLADWDAKLTIRAGNGLSKRLHVAHDFKGHSMWNPLHALTKAALMTSHADIYVCGHRHQFASGQFSVAGQNRVVTAARVGTYKRADPYALHNGFPEEIVGHSCMLIVDPSQPDPLLQVLPPFPDLKLGHEVLQLMRARAQARTRRGGANKSKRKAKRRG